MSKRWKPTVVPPRPPAERKVYAGLVTATFAVSVVAGDADEAAAKIQRLADGQIDEANGEIEGVRFQVCKLVFDEPTEQRHISVAAHEARRR
jgi:hypothetical protein